MRCAPRPRVPRQEL